MPDITPDSLALFLLLAEDSGNWSGTPPTDGNVTIGAAGRGNLTQLKRAGLIKTYRDEGMTWVLVTPEGTKLAAAHGIEWR